MLLFVIKDSINPIVKINERNFHSVLTHEKPNKEKGTTPIN